MRHITATGMYTAPASIPSAATVSVVARLQFDPTKSDSAEYTTFQSVSR